MTQPVQTINLSVVPFSHVIRSSATVITRTVPNLLKVVIKDSKGQSVNHSSVDRWEIAVARDFRQQTPILAKNVLRWATPEVKPVDCSKSRAKQELNSMTKVS